MFLLSVGGGSHARDAESSIEPGGRDPFSAACPVPFSPQAPPSGCRVCEPRPSSSQGPLSSTVNWCRYIVALVLLGLLCGKQRLNLRLGEEQVRAPCQFVEIEISSGRDYLGLCILPHAFEFLLQ